MNTIIIHFAYNISYTKCVFSIQKKSKRIFVCLHTFRSTQIQRSIISSAGKETWLIIRLYCFTSFCIPSKPFHGCAKFFLMPVRSVVVADKVSDRLNTLLWKRRMEMQIEMKLSNYAGACVRHSLNGTAVFNRCLW